MPKCTYCHESDAEPGHACCYDCGAILFEQWKADQDMQAAEEAAELAAVGEPDTDLF